MTPLDNEGARLRAARSVSHQAAQLRATGDYFLDVRNWSESRHNEQGIVGLALMSAADLLDKMASDIARVGRFR